MITKFKSCIDKLNKCDCNVHTIRYTLTTTTNKRYEERLMPQSTTAHYLSLGRVTTSGRRCAARVTVVRLALEEGVELVHAHTGHTDGRDVDVGPGRDASLGRVGGVCAPTVGRVWDFGLAIKIICIKKKKRY